MTFLWPQMLWLLPTALLLTAAIWLRADARRRSRSGDLADTHLYGHVVTGTRTGRTRLVRGLQLAALAALLLAAARPQAQPPLPANRAAVVIALDASRSMLAGDAQPNRLERARELAVEFVESAPRSTLIGVASFSDSAFILVPPTNAREEVLDALDRIEPAANTSLSAAVISGVRMLPGREQAQPPDLLGNIVAGGGGAQAGGTQRGGSQGAGAQGRDAQGGDATGSGPGTGSNTGGGNEPDEDETSDREKLPPGRLLVFSDGVSNVSAAPRVPAEVAAELSLEFAEEQEVAVYTVPVGSEGGTISRIEGQDYFIPFDAGPLEELSERTGGELIDPDDTSALNEAFRDLGRDVRWEATEFELSSVLGGVAALVLVGAGALNLNSTRRVP